MNKKRLFISEIFMDSVYALHNHLKGHVYQTPLIRSALVDRERTLFLKCENLQYTHSFKYRGAISAFFLYQRYEPQLWKRILKTGVVTCSTGNFANALAYVTNLYKVKLSVIVNEWTDKKKLESIIEMNPETEIITVIFEEWKNIMIQGRYDYLSGFFISSEMNPYVTLGNATLGIEILEQLPDVASILIPYGGGNLTYSISAFLKQVKPDINIYTTEVNTCAPFYASFKAGTAQKVHYERSFIDGIGSDFVIPKQFERVKGLVKNALVVNPQEVATIVAQLAIIDKLVVEGAGAVAVAAYLKFGMTDRACCILSGGNINPVVLSNLLSNYCRTRTQASIEEHDVALI